MKYIAEFRDGDGACHIAKNIKAEARADTPYNFTEFCGGHTLLAAMRVHPLGKNAQRIGTVTQDNHCFVQMNIKLGARRVVNWLNGEQSPRIC
jgi:hypothetical protein